MIIYVIVLFVDYVHSMSSRNSCQKILPSKKLWTRQSYKKLHTKMFKILQIPMGEKPVLVVTVVVWMTRCMTTESHMVVSQSEVKVTQETENQVSPPETSSGASAVVSWITHSITVDTKTQSVSSVTKQIICSLNVLTGSPLQGRRKIDNMSVSQRISRN